MAFEQLPDMEYIVITQPHKNKDNQLLLFFTLVDKNPSNAFLHSFYVINRDYVVFNFIKVRKVWREHNDNIWERIKGELGRFIPDAVQEEFEKICTVPKKLTRR